MQFTCKYKPVLFADSLHKSRIAYCEPTFPNHLRGEKKCRRQIRSQNAMIEHTADLYTSLYSSYFEVQKLRVNID